MSGEREPLGEEALAEMAEEIGYRAKRFAASPAESFSRDAELQWMTAHASRLLAEVGRQRERIRALEEALRFYADENNYMYDDPNVPSGGPTIFEPEGGAIARAALSGEATRSEEEGGSQ